MAKLKETIVVLHAAGTIEVYLEVKTDKVNLVSLKRFVRFLRDTDRMDSRQVEYLLDFLKQQRDR